MFGHSGCKLCHVWACCCLKSMAFVCHIYSYSILRFWDTLHVRFIVEHFKISDQSEKDGLEATKPTSDI